MKKTEIFKYDPVVYPVKLHVAFDPELSIVTEHGLSLEGKRIEDTWRKHTTARTYSNIQEAETGHEIVLVVFRSAEKATLPLIAHEAKHVADAVFESIGEDRLVCEPHAYLLAWAVACMLDAKNRKKKD
jgi:hypothetical protein